MRSRDRQREFAPAKINLFLHVGPIGADGYHPICSLMVFADLGDELSLHPAKDMDFALTGPFGGGLPKDDENLVIRARDALLATARPQPGPFRLTLEKRLPVASGLGGGSADAAAALRLIPRALGLHMSDRSLSVIARSLGADVLACFEAQPTIAVGRGDLLSAAPHFPDLHLTLVNPLVTSSTAEVYRASDRAPGAADRPYFPKTVATASEAAAILRACRNDLERPAVNLQPAIGEALAALGGQPETLLARMSGSGATCFALCRSANAATTLATRMRRLNPRWWVRKTAIRGSAAT